jgi:outer membrane lipoprotein-sorting protein
MLASMIALLCLAGSVNSEERADERPMPTLESVMARLAGSGGVEAHFRESRQLTILSEPIESRGVLYFAPPDWLARHVTEPGEAKVVVRDDRVSFRDETGVQVLELGSSEVARAMVGNVIVLMRGDLVALTSQYRVGFEVDGESWKLDLEPRDRVVRQLIERLRVEGHENRLVRMESVETSGDVTVTEFSAVKVGVDFSPEARAEIFSIQPVISAP